MLTGMSEQIAHHGPLPGWHPGHKHLAERHGLLGAAAYWELHGQFCPTHRLQKQMLVRDGAAWFAPARSVARIDAGSSRRTAGAGFHALVDTESLPAGLYLVGIRVHQGEHDYFALGETAVAIGGQP